MNIFERTKKIENAVSIVKSESFFYNPSLDFILATKDDSKSIIGVNEEDVGFLFKPNAYRTIKQYDDIRFKSQERRELYEECVECYILSCLCGDYDLAFMSIDMHVNMWSFIDNYIDDVDFMLKKGVRKYLQFCKETGINRPLLETYGQIIINDLYQAFLDEEKSIEVVFVELRPVNL